MKRLVKELLSFVNETFFLIKFIMVFLFHRGTLKSEIEKNEKEKIMILANGPSLKKDLEILVEKNDFDTEFIVLNFFAETNYFLKLKPRHYCFADPMFFANTIMDNKVKALFSFLIENVTWEMNIYIPRSAYKDFLNFSSLNSNSKIRIIKINAFEYEGKSKYIKKKLFDKAMACPPIGTVANLAIFVALKMGCQFIELYGVDHTFFDGLVLNNKNELCTYERHFYDEKPKLKPMLEKFTGKPYKMSHYIGMVGKMFISHDELSEYADYLNVTIINRTKVSLIDSYSRDYK